MKRLILLLALIPSFSWAQIPGEVSKAVPNKMSEIKKDMKEGWTPKLALGLSYNLVDSDAWIGSDTGTSNTFGVNIKGSYDYKGGQHESRNSLNITEAATKTPTLPTWLKSSDDLKLESLYLYTLKKYPWIGPYGKISAQTSIFKGESVTPTSITYSDKDGNTITTGEVIRLTDGFKPLTLRESIGAFFKIVDDETMKFEARAGIGAIQIMADDQLAVSDVNIASGTGKLTTLTDVDQAGLELGLDLTGSLDKKTSYEVGAEALIPFSNDDPKDRDALELTNWEAHFKLTSKLYEMLAVSYEYKIREQPELLDEVQTQHLFLANLTYTLF